MTSHEPREAPHSGQWGSILRNALLVLTLLGMLWLAFNVRLPSIEQLQSDIEDLGWAGRFAFIGLYAVVAMTPIPVTVMAVTGGLLFGIVEGSILSVIGVLIGCYGAYWLARGLGRRTVMRLLGNQADRVERQLGDAGFQAVCVARLAPGLPYWPVNYGSGAFGVGQRDYVVASIVATIPGQVSLVAIGAFISEQSVLNGALIIISWAVVIAMTIWAYRSWRGLSSHTLPGARYSDSGHADHTGSASG